MTYDKITVGKSINPLTGEHWYKTSATVTVYPGEDPKAVFDKVKSEIDQWLPFDEKHSFPSIAYTKIQENPADQSQYLFDVIQLSTSLKGLERFRAQVEKENNPSLTEAFERRVKELS